MVPQRLVPINNRLPKIWQDNKLAKIKKADHLNWQQFFYHSANKQAKHYLRQTIFNWFFIVPIFGFFYFILKSEKANEKLVYNKLKNQYLKSGGDNWLIFLILYLSVWLSFVIWVTLLIFLTDNFYPISDLNNQKRFISLFMVGNFGIFLFFSYLYLIYWYSFVYRKFKEVVFNTIRITRNQINPFSFFSFVLQCDDGVYLKELEKKQKKLKKKNVSNNQRLLAARSRSYFS
ncbi:unique hypothetical protein [Mycoplasmoides gallisepticum str. R(low)]|uniref:Uncharacterized protein n=2 Tax=Mycoplasmoides gallisepticum TaxID=2096 RepID=Q7NB50_MYCGA|nr:hypothetical protein [Mycoplasmoides gallisepticum]AAP56780.1 unique hypothetical protein [Mycoplasmoides gallisepticum str. R(low)]ADC30637.1 hypothetical protein MGAH_0082 [Mycoplasmoides gallisepticum str. R(high)]